MKIIDLLNKIANGEEVPKKIKYLTSIYTLRSNNNYYVENSDSSHSNGLYYQMIGGSRLNDEVEIIEDKKIKHIENYVDFANLKDDEKFDYLYEMESRIIDKLNSMEE